MSRREVELMQRIGKALGCERAFRLHASHDVLENQYIKDWPPVFSTKKRLAIKHLRLKPPAKKGICNYYAKDAIPKIKTALM